MSDDISARAAPTEPAGNGLSAKRIEELEAVKQSIERLLGYAVGNTDVVVSDALLKQAIKVLRQPCSSFSEEDEFLLWQSQNQLSLLVRPATDLSIQIAQQLTESHTLDKSGGAGFWEVMQFWRRSSQPVFPAVRQCLRELWTILMFLLVSVFLYVLIQGHCALLSSALANSKKYMEDWKTQYQLYNNIQLATGNANAADPATPTQLSQTQQNMRMLAQQISASSQTLIDLIKPVTHLQLFVGNSTASILQECEKSNFLAQQAHYALQIPATGQSTQPPLTSTALLGCLTFEREYAASYSTILARYILPLVLGVIGATAYLVRRTLYHLETNSYMPAARGRLLMRLCLGALLGAISGIFVSNDNQDLQSFNLSLIMLALLMGYSVEVAFGLFDSVIERMRDWTNSLRMLPPDQHQKP